MIELLQDLKEKELALFDSYDRILHDNRCNVSKKETEEAKRRVKVATSLLVKKHTTKRLSDTDLRRYHSLVNRALTEPGFKVCIKHMENGLGIYNDYGDEVFYFVE